MISATDRCGPCWFFCWLLSFLFRLDAPDYELIVTSGIDLALLIGKKFQIGEVTLEGMEHCQPCATLGTRLAHYRLTASEVVKGFKDLGGIRARVVEGGVMRTGDRLELV